MLPAYAANLSQENDVENVVRTPASEKRLVAFPPRRRVLRIVKLTPVDINQHMRDPLSPSPPKGRRAPFIDLSRMKTRRKGGQTKRSMIIRDVSRDEQVGIVDRPPTNSEYACESLLPHNQLMTYV